MTPYTASSAPPRLRHDISGMQVTPTIMALYDDAMYSEKVARLPSDYIELLTLLDGRRTLEELVQLAMRAGRTVHLGEFVKLVNILEREYFLDSPRFRQHKAEVDRRFNENPVRPAAHAGSSYPDDPDELRSLLDDFLAEKGNDSDGHGEPVAIIAPHIDFRVGGRSYGPAYNALRRSKADTFVVFGVGHQMSYDRFMISSKDFDTPLGVVETDRELIERFRQKLPFGLTRNEIAHKREHSVEFQVVFLKHLLGDRPFKIVPILAGSLYDYVEEGDGNAHEDEQLTQLYETLDATARELGRNVCYIAGADLCHVGKKFGDDFPARTVLGKLRELDTQTLSLAARPDADAFLRQIAEVDNQYRVCGVAPIYATLRSSRATRGEVLCYDQWDEVERESAVTFGSVALYRERRTENLGQRTEDGERKNE